MPTDKQLAANRANAARSTGPRTPEGKARSVRHARKHSFAGASFAIIKLEDREAVDRLRHDLIEVFQPANSQETFAIERIALAQHNLLRIARLEAGLGTTALDQSLSNNDTPFIPIHEELQSPREQAHEQNRSYCFAHGFDSMIRRSPATWALFLRYQAQAERQYRRAVEDLERLQALRPKLPPPINDENDDSPNEAIFDAQPEENLSGSASENEPFPGTPPEASGTAIVYRVGTPLKVGTASHDFRSRASHPIE